MHTLAASNSFPFYNWLSAAVLALYNLLYDAFSSLFDFLTVFADLLLSSFFDAGRSAAFFLLAPLGNLLWPIFLTFTNRIGNVALSIASYWWPALSDVFGDLLLWLDSILPPALTLDVSSLTLVSSYFRAADVFIDVSFVLTAFTITVVMSHLIVLARYVWKCIPTIG